MTAEDGVDAPGGRPPGREPQASGGAAAGAIDDENNGASMETIEAEFDSDIAALTNERDEFRAVAQRLQADFENFKKRAQREQADVVARANARLLEELLPALDSFDLAAASLENGDQADVDKLAKGVTLAIGQLRDALERAGLARIAAEGAPFDPEEHEAVMHEEGDGDPVVDTVLRPGYRLNGRTLRPAMVKVSRVSQ